MLSAKQLDPSKFVAGIAANILETRASGKDRLAALPSEVAGIAIPATDLARRAAQFFARS